MTDLHYLLKVGKSGIRSNQTCSKSLEHPTRLIVSLAAVVMLPLLATDVTVAKMMEATH